MAKPKLSALDADVIRLEYSTGLTSQRKLAIRYKVSQAAIWQVVSEKTFKRPEKGDAT